MTNDCPLSCGKCKANHPVDDCRDYHPQCANNAAEGRCRESPWFLENCRKSCGMCMKNIKQLQKYCKATYD
ncbi:unnamed protein product [Bursaphelenchus okinawaensis]|uniref:ShKT domain-containing protein n=1 Tax=Bursaphelenchus okinawaensis TaxID=465554 RepID=A0A811L0J8_9BILA|nr:unnamed protein product [Bursaphelenchus okinawaensis]CAG9114338.1 unnamed protein product [Bursaphelenchus okinawaensis]